VVVETGTGDAAMNTHGAGVPSCRDAVALDAAVGSKCVPIVTRCWYTLGEAPRVVAPLSCCVSARANDRTAATAAVHVTQKRVARAEVGKGGRLLVARWEEVEAASWRLRTTDGRVAMRA